ncbi:MAG: superoxide dismutase [Gemmatimonadaceae bacterium]|nr:superoxide dismutase [Acetobacteraceae bacterium]
MIHTRRSMFGMAAGLAAVALAPRAVAQTSPGPFTLPPLPYAPAANEPHIDAQTMLLHHDRHHAAYVTALNTVAKDNAALGSMPIPTLLGNLADLPDGIRTMVRNNGGGHANHSMFWQIMGGKGGAPTGELLAAFDRDLGGMDAMKAAFGRMGVAQFGSGWVFVTVDATGKLSLSARPNQDSPLMDGGRALLGNDVWEHAYYLKYQSRREDYLAAWWNVVNWDAVAMRYAQAKAGTLGV